MIKDGSKKQTVRSFRKHPVKAGQLAHLYYGMRTSNCTKLVENSPVISHVATVFLSATGGLCIIETNWIDEFEREKILLHGPAYLETLEKTVGIKHKWLSENFRDMFAYNDGFRHQDKPMSHNGCFEIMYRWWKQTHDLPFIGNVIYF